MGATSRKLREAIDNAAVLCTLADMVEHYQLDTVGLDNTIRVFRETASRELPYIMLRAAKAMRGVHLAPAELAALLKAEANKQALRNAGGPSPS